MDSENIAQVMEETTLTRIRNIFILFTRRRRLSLNILFFWGGAWTIFETREANSERDNARKEQRKTSEMLNLGKFKIYRYFCSIGHYFLFDETIIIFAADLQFFCGLSKCYDNLNFWTQIFVILKGVTGYVR